MNVYRSKGTLSDYIEALPWPGDFLKPDDLPTFLSKIYVVEDYWRVLDDGVRADIWAAVEGELGVRLPGLDRAKLVIGADIPGYTLLKTTLQVGDTCSLALHDIVVALRFDPELLKPAPPTPQLPPPPFAQISISGTVRIDSDFNIVVEGFNAINLDPVYIGNTGIIVSATGVKLDLSRSATIPEIAAAGFDESFIGVYVGQAQIRFPDSLSGIIPNALSFDDCAIGSGGVSGKVQASYGSAQFDQTTKSFSGAGAGNFLGVPFGLESIDIQFFAGALIQSEIKGAMLLPFFEQPVDVEIGFGLDGDFTVALANTTTGLATLSINNILDIELDSLGFDVKDGELAVKLGGKLTPTFGDFNWPSFDVKELSIDSKGHVQLEGGWIDLPKQYSLDFHGFKVDITKFGLGRNDDGTKWYGVSGGVELVKGMPAGASVKGLRVTTDENWGDAKISFEGVGVEFEVPGVFQFKGEVDFREFPDPDPPHDTVHRFDGDITLRLESIDLEIDGTLVAGSTQGYNFFALYIHTALPEGIPWGSLPFAFYGFGGLLALNMGPNKLASDPWYGLGNQGWYNQTPVGVEKLEKWKNIHGNRAFGAAVDLGTYEDGGYLFNGRVLFALILPGPVAVLQGFFNLLKDRAELGDDAMFRTIAVYDKPAGTLQFGVDATYQYDEASGDLIEISGGLDAFYDFNNPDAWYIHLGEDTPRENRIQARVLSMFDAQAYLMLDAHKLAMGSWIGYQKSWHFSKLSVALEAWMEDNAVVSFKPAHLHAGLCLHGSVQLKVLKFGLGLSVDALIEADVIKPFHLLGDFRVSIDLPKPLKDISADVSLEWGPRPNPPPRPIAFKQVAIGHFKSSVTWPLPLGALGVLGALVLPSYDSGGGFLGGPTSTTDDISAPPGQLPVVPVDCRPSITFARNVWDDALVGATVQPLDPPWEQIGDPVQHQGPARARYGLSSVRLAKYENGAWTTIAAASGATTANPKLFGSWSAASAIGGNGPAQTKLTLWSLSGLDHYRNTSADWGSRFGAQFPDYPCCPPPKASRVCLDFENLMRFGFYEAPFRHPDHSGVSVTLADMKSTVPPPRVRPDGTTWDDIDPRYWKEDYDEGGELFPGTPPGFVAYTAPPGLDGHRQELCPLVGAAVVINFDAPANDVRIIAVGRGGNPVVVTGVDKSGQPFGPIAPNGNVTAIAVADVVQVKLDNGDNVCLVEICAILAPPKELTDAYQSIEAHNQDATSLWSGAGNVLEPFTQYRLRIETSVATADYAYDNNYNTTENQVQYAYFATGGPPGVGSLTVPVNTDANNFDSGLDDLTRYVEQTVPLTVPAKGQKPLSPRPVYRSYDAKVIYNENYVSLMYRMAGRDLALLLYDRNNLPVRDSTGRLMVADNPWDTKPVTTLSASEQQWTSMLNASQCVSVDVSSIRPDDTMMAGAEDQILAHDMLYEARLVPCLMHEDFRQFAIADHAGGSGARFRRWQIADHPAITSGPSLWEIEAAGSSGAKRVVQKAAIGIPGSAVGLGAPPGTMLVLGDFPGLGAGDPSQPAQWSDCRLSLILRSSLGAAVGAAFRYAGADDHYLFVMDRLGSVRRLVRIQNGVESVLAQDGVAYALNTDYRLVVEAIGSSLRVYLDDALVFDVLDSALTGGGMALYCSGGNGSAFSDIQAQDFSVKAISAYKFSFTTSPFVDFRHHMHSFEDGCWKLSSSLADGDFAALAANSAAALANTSSDAEARAFESIAADALGSQALQAATKLEVSKVERAGQTDALLVRGPQPFGFSRNGFALKRAIVDTPTAISPMRAKIAQAVLRALSPQAEAITLLLLEPMNLSGCRVEKRDVPVLGPTVALDDPASQWSLVYEFPAMPVLGDGMCIAVLSCGPDAAPARALRTTQQFRAASGNPGSLALDADAVDLRLVSSNGEVLHARRFLADAAYQDIAGCTYLRKADETAFIVFPPASSATGFAPGSFRLSFSYRLDNTANDASSVVLSRAGDSTPEAADLDFAWVPFGE